MTSIARERPEQRAEVLALNRVVFKGEEEARIIGALTRDGLDVLSLVAMNDGKISGHILFSQLDVEVDGRKIVAAALAPMAVLPDYQGRGIGTALVRRGLQLLTEQGLEAVIVLGHIDFYPRFGFLPSLARHLASPFQGMDAFMAMELRAGALQGASGTCLYPAAFEL